MAFLGDKWLVLLRLSELPECRAQVLLSSVSLPCTGLPTGGTKTRRLLSEIQGRGSEDWEANDRGLPFVLSVCPRTSHITFLGFGFLIYNPGIWTQYFLVLGHFGFILNQAIKEVAWEKKIKYSYWLGYYSCPIFFSPLSPSALYTPPSSILLSP